MSSGNSQAFLSLIRLGINHQANPVKIYDWACIKALADEQGLSAIIIDGIEKLPESQRPPKELTLQWIGEVMQNYEYRYSDYERAIGDLAGFYEKHGVKMMVLKGYGLSLNYPNPKHRPCGDIDTWNFGKQEEADAVLKTELGIPVDTSEHHHTVFYWKKYMVENHYDMLITSAVRANSQLEPILKELSMDDSHKIEINGQPVYLPSANFNALFLLRHMLMHFVAEGMTFRQILDWAFFWEKRGKDVNVEWYKGVVDEFNMSSFCNIVNAICVEELGFDPRVFPSVQFNPVLKDRVLAETFSPEFDWKDAHQSGLFSRVQFKYKRWKGGSWKRKFCYGESDWQAFWQSVWMHLTKPSSI